MFNERYKGIRIAVSRAAMRELMKEAKTLFDVVEVLEEGYHSPRKRKPEIIEKWLDKGSKTFEAVIAKDYDEIMKENIWKLIHFGKFSKRKR